MGDKKLAVLSLIAEDTPKVTNPQNVDKYSFANAVETANKLLPEIREQADYVVVLSHMGYYPNGEHHNAAPGDVTLARNVEGLNLIIGGHSHTQLDRPVVENGVNIVQTGWGGMHLGRIDVTLGEDGSFTLNSYKLIPINEKKDGKFTAAEIPEDAELKNFLQSYQDAGSESLSVKIGSLSGTLNGERADVRFKETNMGNFIADAMRSRTQADIAIMNSGGIRASIQEGDVSYRDVLTVQPFANTLVTVDLSAKELTDYLSAVSKLSPGTGAFPQFAGLSFSANAGTISNLKVNGEPVSDSKTYRLCVNSFVAAGGDGYPALNTHKSFVDTGYVDANALSQYISNKKNINAADYSPKGLVTGIGS